MVSRRLLLQVFGAAALAPVVLPGEAQSASAESEPYAASVLPPNIRSRFVNNGNGIRMHVLEAGFETRNRPLVVLLHGFPELAYSWRKVMPALASAGYHVVAPDLRGYGRTSSTDVKYEDDLGPFRTLNEVRDIVGLVSAFGYRAVAAVVGHDFGSPVAAWCSVVRPDIFHAVVMMSGPFTGPPAMPFDSADAKPSSDAAAASPEQAYDGLEKLNPPRKYYQRYYSTRGANMNMWHAPQGVHAFLRAYYHMKSADWSGNKPLPLKGWSANELARMPHYYVMELNRGMAETVASELPAPADIAACKWLPDDELKVYAAEYSRTGFQGGLQSYRVGSSGRYTADPQNNVELKMFSGRTIDVPSLFIAGKSDWGVYQRPGAFERMQTTVCTQMRGAHLIEGAGHWVQQEQPERVSNLILQFLQRENRRAPRG